MGAQMVQRHAILHKLDLSEGLLRKLHFWIGVYFGYCFDYPRLLHSHVLTRDLGNPGSMAWIVPERPLPIPADCPTFDDWKYGINGGFVPYASDAALLGRSGIVNRYRSRNVHYLWGTVSGTLLRLFLKSHYAINRTIMVNGTVLAKP
jgi:hypothetical protein